MKLDTITRMNKILFDDKTEAFENPNLVFEKNTVYYLEGDNGSGKTTLFRYLDSLSNDTIYLGQNYYDYIFDWKPLWWNIALPIIGEKDKNECTEIVSKLLFKFKLNDINEKSQVYTLSGGEKHIVVLLRFLFFIKNIQTMFLDEPETGLDLNNKEIFWNILFNNSHDYTIILTSHNLIRNKQIKKKEIKKFKGINNSNLTFYKLTKS